MKKDKQVPETVEKEVSEVKVEKGVMADYFTKYYKAYKNDYISQYYKAYKELKAKQMGEVKE